MVFGIRLFPNRFIIPTMLHHTIGIHAWPYTRFIQQNYDIPVMQSIIIWASLILKWHFEMLPIINNKYWKKILLIFVIVMRQGFFSYFLYLFIRLFLLCIIELDACGRRNVAKNSCKLGGVHFFLWQFSSSQDCTWTHVSPPIVYL